MICCDFCRKSHHEVGHMIAGPRDSHVAICDECAALSHEIAQEACASDSAPDADSYFVLWAEVEAAYQGAAEQAEGGVFDGGPWIELGGRIREALDRFHGRHGELSDHDLSQLLKKIRGASQEGRK